MIEAIMNEKIVEFARAFGRFTMREKGYTTLLCSRLESALPYRVFTPSGAMVTTVHQHLTPEELEVAARLRNGNDFYPDVLITGKPLTDLAETNLRQLEAITPLGVEALLEEVGEDTQLREDGAPGRLGRMGGEHGTELQTVDERADQLSMYTTLFDDPDRINTELARVRNVTTADVRAYATRYLRQNKRAVLRYVPRNGATS